MTTAQSDLIISTPVDIAHQLLVDVKSFAALTTHLVEELTQTTNTLISQTKEQTLTTLKMMKAKVFMLKQLAGQNKLYNKIRGEECQRRLESVLNELAIAVQSKDELADFMRSIEVAIEGDQKRLQENEAAREVLQNQINELETEKFNLSMQQFEQMDYGSLPIIGPAIGKIVEFRNLMERVEERSLLAMNDQNRLAQEQISITEVIEQSRERLNVLRSTLNNRQDNITELETIKAQLELQNKAIAQEVTLASVVELYYASLEHKVDVSQKRIEGVEDMTLYTADSEDSVLQEARAIEATSFKEALEKVGYVAEVGMNEDSLTLKEALLRVSQSGEQQPLLLKVKLEQMPVLPEGLQACLWQEESAEEPATYLMVKRHGLNYWPLNYKDNPTAFAIIAYNNAGQQQLRVNQPNGYFTGSLSLDLLNDTLVLMCKMEEGLIVPFNMPWSTLRPMH